MKLKSQRILITGAGGGIGAALSMELATEGARLFLLDRRQESVDPLVRDVRGLAEGCMALACDITRADHRQSAMRQVEKAWGGVDLLINLAGVMDFAPFHEEDPAMIQRILQVNVEAPMQLARAVLPHMIEQGRGRIVNMGSMFGSIAFPCFAAYSASKFALRGFSQALRRELASTGVGVTYISPRAVRTAFNPPVVHHMADQGLMRMDEPAWVARKIVEAIKRDRQEVYLGFPESLFARINAVLPNVVDKSLAKQVPALMDYALSARQH
jgi:short-subunit dehydrogenase